jgi:hypothetical protein
MKLIVSRVTAARITHPVSRQVIQDVVKLHERMNHPCSGVMAAAVRSGAWTNLTVMAIDIERVFRVYDCYACRVGKMNRLTISLGSGVRPNRLGWLSSDFVPVKPTAR